MGLRDTLKLAKQAMSPENIKQGLAASTTPSEEQLQAALATMTPEQRAAYDANMAQAAASQQAAIEASNAYRVLEGPAGDFLYGPSASDQMAAYQTGGV